MPHTPRKDDYVGRTRPSREPRTMKKLIAITALAGLS